MLYELCERNYSQHETKRTLSNNHQTLNIGEKHRTQN